MKNLIAITVLLNFFIIDIFSQTVLYPNICLKSHETLEITKVELTPGKTIIYLRLENRIAEGSFCADKNIYIISAEGYRVRLLSVSNISVCPDNYKFKSIGEKLDFSLSFPPLEAGSQWFDIIEECSANCFWFYGITLNTDLNKRLDEAFAIASKGKPEDNIHLFRKIIDDIDDQDLGIEGSLYINIINAAVEAGDKVEAAVWYKRLLSSQCPRLSQYVKFLNDKGIKY